jgi:hypothetical protein
MAGIAARSTRFLALAALLFAVAAASASAAPSRHGRFLGVVPHVDEATAAHVLSLADVIKAAGPTTLTFDAGYQTLLNQYFADVAHDSGGSANVYSAATQYSDGSGSIQYQSTVGGSVVDNDPLPVSGCDDGFDTYCLTDAQLETEIQTVMTAQGWHGGLNHMFFLMTPNGVGSCFDASGSECTTNTFCAYHSYFTNSSSEQVIYANEPYLGPSNGCTDPSQGFPNNDVDSDTTINTISHEHNEAITDPLTDNSHLAWIANDGPGGTPGDENGDLCAYGFGTKLGGTAGVDAFNQVINGHHYELQQEYSNVDGGCVQHLGGAHTPAMFGAGPLVYHGGPVMHTNTTYAIYWLPTARNVTAPVVTGTALVNQTLTTTAGTWADGGVPSSYQWQRCSSTGTACADIPGATATTYQLTSADGGHVVRSTVRATNVNGASAPAPSAGTALVIDVPASTAAPHISGRAKVGKKLSGSHGTWTYSPAFRYQWLRCNSHGGSCSSIHSATRSSYKLTKHDAGHELRLRITATNAAGSAVAISAPTARVKR